VHKTYVKTVTADPVRVWHNFAMHRDDPGNNSESEDSAVDVKPPETGEPPKEIGGRGGLDPTRYGDWEKAGRCIDF
jgi:hypothetical protein